MALVKLIFPFSLHLDKTVNWNDYLSNFFCLMICITVECRCEPRTQLQEPNIIYWSHHHLLELRGVQLGAVCRE